MSATELSVDALAHLDRPRTRRRAAVALAAWTVLPWTGGQAAGAPDRFVQQLALLGIVFKVTSPNQAAGNRVRIEPSGLEVDNTPLDLDIAGQVERVEVADLNTDRSPELYIHVRGPAPDRRGTLVAVSANKRKSLSFITLPDLAAHRGASQGYRGHDDMAVVEGRFVRRFPLYGKNGDATLPSGRTRQLQYRLTRGESSWVLQLDRTFDY